MSTNLCLRAEFLTIYNSCPSRYQITYLQNFSTESNILYQSCYSSILITRYEQAITEQLKRVAHQNETRQVFNETKSRDCYNRTEIIHLTGLLKNLINIIPDRRLLKSQRQSNHGYVVLTFQSRNEKGCNNRFEREYFSYYLQNFFRLVVLTCTIHYIHLFSS